MSEHIETPKLSGQFSKAMVYAELKHHNQVRKGGDIPYVGHLLSVASLVINDGGPRSRPSPRCSSGTTRACSGRIANTGWTAGWWTNSAGWSPS